ncbi:MAG: stage II sporulation protein P [Bacillota bacterium]
MKTRQTIILLALAAVVSVTAAVWYGVTTGPWAPGPRPEGERARGFTTILGEDRQVLLRTGLSVSRGDEFITGVENAHYIVTRIFGRTAVARLVAPATAPKAVPSQTQRTSGSRTIVIYYTHSDESYTPEDGTPTIPGNGTIYEVGTTFAAALRSAGFVVVDDPTRHDPHDNQAYIRSRRTAYQDIQMYNPFAVLDLHRDSAPASDYIINIGGQQAQEVMIVVGQQNLTMAANLFVAKQIKATADGLYPGFVKAIFMGHGNYNQDLMATALLFEFGTETAPRAAANQSAKLMANVLAQTFSSAGP